MIEEIKLDEIMFFLKELPKSYNSPTIDVARGKYKYKNTWFNRIKRYLNG